MPVQAAHNETVHDDGMDPLSCVPLPMPQTGMLGAMFLVHTSTKGEM